MTSFLPQSRLKDILCRAPVVPVVVIEKLVDATSLARALVAGGLSAIEVTLRTEAALEAIRIIAAEVEGAVVGAGTVLSPRQLEAAREAGARFAVSPGATEALLNAAGALEMPLLPGAASASEAMALIARGYQFAKFFPAEPAGGIPYLKALASPLPQLQFCPTGGLTPETAPNYLALPNVICVGGSWMLRPQAIAARDWEAVTAASKQAAGLHKIKRQAGPLPI
ncbi:bifunctional 4-hydroxy-2-oxoglutarate aldolase/2-dehydro-3-deoxy-phosphogluconate aldolase [Bradyrhizobium sp. CCGUVB1N3]|uniref:bifunctional 4-hydroxy-2-oxoglutarate aldolase/2-dehydro-3-deoxy-phosphogluconate aldolase n=1 Tax=Bradyrhizobium sp. CCGUVB1N3 TaxID=2949629 RepID=UPI0020B38E48|nr:bifunctional 4-hydroxy-2-oxoglutarate aldolase/2-dehydro-3-deoxy-phosphogluconate aldolase [Bradyrhizobium sp. CCGUVB1N3]MCP3476832.1 bifunctional 4-hydroxy-2-oxoglutarate aldolase/2-dehydro-3-deoxy-phosphogluconate aldolase [Bradyrhizobium sp. CCGUVB1N3]